MRGQVLPIDHPPPDSKRSRKSSCPSGGTNVIAEMQSDLGKPDSCQVGPVSMVNERITFICHEDDA